MDNWKKITEISVVVSLILTLLYGCGSIQTADWTEKPIDVIINTQPTTEAAEHTTQAPTEALRETTQNSHSTYGVPEEKPAPVEPKEVENTDKVYTCTVSIKCTTILDNMDMLDPGKADIVPADGIVLTETKVTFNEDESVFDILKKVCMDNKIHMEFVNTPIYNSAYIEGIANIYEFDCGNLSGWMYSVNDWYPNYGCSSYQLKDGDIVKWAYTCDQGSDIGGGFNG